MTARSMDRIKMPPGFWEGLRQLGIAPQDVARKAGLPLILRDLAGVFRLGGRHRTRDD